MSVLKSANKKFWVPLIILFIFVFLGITAFVSYAKLSTPNFVRAGAALVSIHSDKVEYKDVQKWPNKVILASPDNAAALFDAYLAEEGYTVTDRAGAVFHLEKDGQAESVAFHVNGYYSTWVWEA